MSPVRRVTSLLTLLLLVAVSCATDSLKKKSPEEPNIEGVARCVDPPNDATTNLGHRGWPQFDVTEVVVAAKDGILGVNFQLTESPSSYLASAEPVSNTGPIVFMTVKIVGEKDLLATLEMTWRERDGAGKMEFYRGSQVFRIGDRFEHKPELRLPDPEIDRNGFSGFVRIKDIPGGLPSIFTWESVVTFLPPGAPSAATAADTPIDDVRFHDYCPEPDRSEPLSLRYYSAGARAKFPNDVAGVENSEEECTAQEGAYEHVLPENDGTSYTITQDMIDSLKSEVLRYDTEGCEAIDEELEDVECEVEVGDQLPLWSEFDCVASGREGGLLTIRVVLEGGASVFWGWKSVRWSKNPKD